MLRKILYAVSRVGLTFLLASARADIRISA